MGRSSTGYRSIVAAEVVEAVPLVAHGNRKNPTQVTSAASSEDSRLGTIELSPPSTRHGILPGSATPLDPGWRFAAAQKASRFAPYY